MRHSSWLRTMARTVASAVLLTALSFSIAFATSLRFHNDHEDSGFTITSSISSSSTAQVPADLYPGVARFLWYTAHNPSSSPITVTMLRISSVQAPRACPIANLDDGATTFTGSLVVPARGASSVAVPISLRETGVNQDSCQHTTFLFTFTGTAVSVANTATATVVTSSQNPSVVGQSVTYHAVVSRLTGGPSGSAPSGTVTFDDGSTPICVAVVLAAGPGGSSSASCAPSAYALAGTHHITAVFSPSSGDFITSTSAVLDQVVRTQPRDSLTLLTSSLNPSVQGAAVTLTASVAAKVPVASAPLPTGTVTFYQGTLLAHVVLGSAPLGASGTASVTTSSLATGTDPIFAVYAGDANFSASTSPLLLQVVQGRPGDCNGPYVGWFVSTGAATSGSSGNDFFFAPDGAHAFRGGDGNDCVDVGRGDDDISAGNGRNHVHGGDGNDHVTLGNGDDVVVLGSGSDVVALGDGNDVVTLGDGSHSRVTLGNGNDVLTLGVGSFNSVVLGNGRDVVTITGSQDSINAGRGSETIYLGSGTGNSYHGAAGQSNVCHLPTPPSSWHASVASYYHDTIVNCTVVSP